MDIIPPQTDNVTPLTYGETRRELERIREEYAAGTINVDEWVEQVHYILFRYQVGADPRDQAGTESLPTTSKPPSSSRAMASSSGESGGV